MCESVAGRWDLGRTSRLSAPDVQFCAQSLQSGAVPVAIASVCAISGIAIGKYLEGPEGPEGPSAVLRQRGAATAWCRCHDSAVL